MVGVTKIQRGNANYWLNAVAEGGDDYYTKPGEAPGEWVGELAAEMGLEGQVDADAYATILEGSDPISGDQLLTRPATKVYERPDGSQRRAEPVLGYDVRFSAPKSVSLLYALGDEEIRTRLLAVYDEAVGQGLAHLESQACLVARGDGGARIERGEGFVAMAFRHRMSRAGDPALHTHVLVSNMTRSSVDGRWLTLASPKGRSPLWTHGKSAGVVFQASLRAGILREFGMEFEAVRHGYADLRGFSREMIEAFSTRSREIGKWLEQHGVSSVAAAQTAAYRTRDAKDYGVDPDKRRAEWIEQAESYGLTPQGVREMAEASRSREPRLIADADLGAALAQLEASTSHFDRRALLWALADQLPDGADVHALDTAVDRLLASERVICVHESRDLLDQAHFTTPRLAELERAFIDGALAGVEANVGRVARLEVEQVLARHAYLGPDQREMVLRLTTGGEQVVPVAAWPGTGKTTALAAAREAWEAAGHPVIGVATARTASGELSDAGVPATSIAALLRRAEEWKLDGTGLGQGTVVVVDEASTTATPQLEALRSLVLECEGKLVVIGDPRQIGAVGPGGLYGHLTRVMEPATLDVIRRQHREPDRHVVALVHEGRGSEALDLLRTQGRLIVGDDLRSTLDGLLVDWHRDFATGSDAVMIARRNRDVAYLNDRARELRVGEGALGQAEVLVGERLFAAGDRVQTRVNAPGIDNRQRWDVTSVDAAARTVELQRVGGDGRAVVLGPAYLDRRTPDGDPALQHAYAVTKFGAESKTFDRAYPLLDAGASLEEELVALSRGREVANVYAVASSELVDPDLGPGRREVSDELHDIRAAIEREGGDYPAAEVALRKRVEELSETALAQRRSELAEPAPTSDPTERRRERLGREIERAEEALGRLGGEREALEAMRRPDAHELSRVRAAEATTAESLERLRPRLAELPAAAAPIEPRRADPARRLEAALIDRRIEQLARRAVAAARLDRSDPLYKALGPYPSDPAKAYVWGHAAHVVSTYRQRHGVWDRSKALGAKPRDQAARAERASAKRVLKAAQLRLGMARERSASRKRERGRSMSIGR
jgi:conjugative relaxase-like TrwC/TraI family protein